MYVRELEDIFKRNAITSIKYKEKKMFKDDRIRI